jgi:hypothetical protein
VIGCSIIILIIHNERGEGFRKLSSKVSFTADFISKNVWIVAGILFVGLFFPLMAREWLLLQDEGRYDVEWHSTSLTTLLQRDLEENQPLAEALDHIDRPENYAELDRNISGKIGHLGLLKVKIYNSQGTIVYASDQSQVGKKITGSEGFSKALTGETVSEIIPREEYLREYGESAKFDMAEVYVPILNGTNSNIAYVFEAYFDYTPIKERTTRLLLRNSASLATIISIFIVLHTGLYLNKRRLRNKIEALESLLPICQHCKQIRVETPDKPDRWETVEAYFTAKDRVKFSHGICDDCMDEHYPGIKDFKSTSHSEDNG